MSEGVCGELKPARAATDLSMTRMTCIEDLRQAASRKVPRAFFDFVEGGSYTEQTLAANCADFERIKLRQRVLIDVSNRSTRSTILGDSVSLPLALAPVGLCGMLHRDGEILACRAAQAAGIPFCLSTMSVCSIEDVAAAVKEPFWFQMFLMKDRGFVRSLVERAGGCKMQRARCHARSAGDRPAPSRPAKRHGHAAEAAPQNDSRYRRQAGLGLRHRARQTPDARQSRRSDSRRR
jgi:isopentenyl diphosphate isomerase/L-lactate dehydrogenase-like FMN-dependent dehydrogenase